MALGDAGKHLASAAAELAKSVAAAGDAVAGAAQAAGGLVSQKAKEQALKAQEARRERLLEKLSPVFRSEYFARDFDLPQIVVVEDEDQRKGEELCEGAIGWLTRSDDGTEVLHVYNEFVPESGLSFHPMAKLNGAYYRDEGGSDRFIDLECYFEEIQKEKLAELQYVAQCLGAVSCRVESMEEQRSESKAKRSGKVEGRARGLGNASAAVDASATSGDSAMRKTMLSQRFTGCDEPVHPQLNWFKHDRAINNLVEARCAPRSNNATKEYVIEVDCSASSVMSEESAAKINGALKGCNIKCAAKLSSQLRQESRKRFRFVISF